MQETGPFTTLDVCASGLAAERSRIAIVARNIANAGATGGTPGEEPFRRQQVAFETVLRKVGNDKLPLGGVRVARITSDPRPFERVFRPGHPAADEEGWLELPNVDLSVEMVDLMDAVRSYEANLTALRTYREMLQRTLEITR